MNQNDIYKLISIANFSENVMTNIDIKYDILIQIL